MKDTSGNQPRAMSKRQVLAYFENWPLDGALRQYLEYHAERYAFLMGKARGLAAGPTRVMDIGISFQTELLRDAFPGSPVDTFGYADDRFPMRGIDRHTHYDLNQAPDPASWPALEEKYGLVVMAEVIEHLHTAARPVLQCVASYLSPGGALILQTPNAVSLGRRTAMARGNNPFAMIREDRTNAGHFCEFTVEDLRRAVESAGLRVEEAAVENYFGPDGLRGLVYEGLCAALPGSLRDGITLIARKPASD